MLIWGLKTLGSINLIESSNGDSQIPFSIPEKFLDPLEKKSEKKSEVEVEKVEESKLKLEEAISVDGAVDGITKKLVNERVKEEIGVESVEEVNGQENHRGGLEGEEMRVKDGGEKRGEKGGEEKVSVSSVHREIPGHAVRDIALSKSGEVRSIKAATLLSVIIYRTHRSSNY